MSRPKVEYMDEIIGKEIKVLDHGFIRVIDYMGDDAAVVQAARVSYGKGTKTVSEDAGLINYLMRHRHTTPFEMCEIKLHVKLPIFVARQWIRHRTGSFNEYSARYSILDTLGLARELARMVLPINFYSQWYWKVDLKNLLDFLNLRTDPHAQYEIRVYADEIEKILRQWVPITYGAYKKHMKDGVNLSAEAIEVIRSGIYGDVPTQENSGLSKREWNELMEVLGRQK